MSSFSGSIVPAYIETGQVVDVDIDNYTVSVVTQFTQKAMLGLSFATPYQHYANGEGIYFMPEVGSLVWVCFPSDGGKPFVMAWAPARDEADSLRSGKKGLNPGDIYLGTRDDNFLILRRGGVVQIGGGPLSQRMFIPVNNTIKDFCENYGLHSLGGDLEWTIDRPETTVDGKRPAHFRLKAREFANDEMPVAVLEIGSHTANPANILSLVINASGMKGAAKKISLEFRKDGSASWTYAGAVTWTVNENLAIHSLKNLSMKGDLLAVLEGGNVKVSSKAGTVDVDAKTVLNLFAGGQVLLGPQVTIGPPSSSSPPVPVLMGDPDFLTWLASHTHSIPSPGAAATLGPVEPPPAKPSKTIFGK